MRNVKEVDSGYRTVGHAADALGISPSGVRKAIQRGTLTALRAYGIVIVSLDEIARYRRDHLGRVGRPRKEANG